uniref:Uncharacterized protein n=1 Tax=uncultured Planctomycetota bacterium TaxID=120965 RepID=A0A5B8KBE4_9BACT|nr:hypothetical protein fos2004AM_00021 [uncultured Planctomycetota bacterium]
MGDVASPSGEPFEPAGMQGVYLVPIELLEQHTLPWFINGRPVRAWAPHPEHEDLLYLTTEHPELLSFLPEPYVEAD